MVFLGLIVFVVNFALEVMNVKIWHSQRQIVTVKFILWTEFSLCVYLEAFQERCLGFPKRAYFSKSVVMVTRGEPLKKKTQLENIKIQKLRASQWGGEWSDCRIMAWSLQCKWDAGCQSCCRSPGLVIGRSNNPGVLRGRSGREPTISR